MKQFIVDRHTTPNTPTLEQVPTEKIPVYEDMDAAAADLANLAENQIIATHDTGSELSAPVDTVQSGNMHAITSNAVAGSLSYSTTEQKTGGYWINGKPIYRKVVSFGALPNSTDKSINHNISNIDFIVKVEGVTTDGTFCFEIPRAGIPNTYLVDLYTTKTKTTIETSIDYSAYTTTYVIIEYTKTTD